MKIKNGIFLFLLFGGVAEPPHTQVAGGKEKKVRIKKKKKEEDALFLNLESSKAAREVAEQNPYPNFPRICHF